MNDEQCKGLRDAIEAKLNGKPWQWSSIGATTWETEKATADLNGNLMVYQYRAKPEPVSRPWSKPEDVPGPVCWIKLIPYGWACLIVEVEEVGISIGGGPALKLSWQRLRQDNATYSTDRNTWHPCTVEESA